MSKIISLVCLNCGRKFDRFLSQSNGAKFCSVSCKSSFRIKSLGGQSGEKNPAWRGGKAKRVCEFCGTEFADYHRKNGRERKYCSVKCGWDAKRKTATSVCNVCDMAFSRRKSEIRANSKFCSHECHGKWLGGTGKGRPKSVEHAHKIGDSCRGDKHYNWKGGVTPANRKERNSVEMKEWQQNVFERDGYKCFRCGKRGGYLHAHHILSFAEYPEFRFSTNNGTTLCVPCHKLLHDGLGGGACFGPNLFKSSLSIQLDIA